MFSDKSHACAKFTSRSKEAVEYGSRSSLLHFFFYLPNGYNTNFSSDPIIFTFCLLMHFISSFHIEYGGKTSKISSDVRELSYGLMFHLVRIIVAEDMARCFLLVLRTQGVQ